MVLQSICEYFSMFEPVNRKCDGAVSFQGNRATPLILNTFNRSVRKLDWEPVSSTFLFAFFRESVGTCFKKGHELMTGCLLLVPPVLFFRDVLTKPWSASLQTVNLQQPPGPLSL